MVRPCETNALLFFVGDTDELSAVFGYFIKPDYVLLLNPPLVSCSDDCCFKLLEFSISLSI